MHVIRAVSFFLLLGSAGRLVAQQGSPPTFADVRPLFEDNCVMCHNGPKAPKGLKLDSYESVLKGSDRGSIVRPRDPRGSELILRVRGITTPRMPLSGPPWLDEKEIVLLEAWIDNGAMDATTVEQQRRTVPSTAKDLKAVAAVTFKDIAPIFKANCMKCHNHRGLMGSPPEGLVLAGYREVMTGTERAYIIPGNPDASELVRKVRGQSLPRMPFDGPPFLTPEEIALIEKWVDQGAMDETGDKAELPIGRKVRLRGRLTGDSSLDGLSLTLDPRTVVKKRTSIGDYVEVRGWVSEAGSIRVQQVRARKPSSDRDED